MFEPGSKNRLTAHDLARFEGEGLCPRVARVVCGAGCLPRKELYESWAVARHVHRRFRNQGGRLIELCAGHGLLAQLLALMDASFTDVSCVDSRPPKSAATLAQAMTARWTQLARVRYGSAELESAEVRPGDLVVSAHACGVLTDRVIDRVIAARARVAVLPCCHEIGASPDGGLSGWLEPTLAIDVTRAARLEAAGYAVSTRTIDPAITPKNRLLLAAPSA